MSFAANTTDQCVGTNPARPLPIAVPPGFSFAVDGSDVFTAVVADKRQQARQRKRTADLYFDAKHIAATIVGELL